MTRAPVLEFEFGDAFAESGFATVTMALDERMFVARVRAGYEPVYSTGVAPGLARVVVRERVVLVSPHDAAMIHTWLRRAGWSPFA